MVTSYQQKISGLLNWIKALLCRALKTHSNALCFKTFAESETSLILPVLWQTANLWQRKILNLPPIKAEAVSKTKSYKMSHNSDCSEAEKLKWSAKLRSISETATFWFISLKISFLVLLREKHTGWNIWTWGRETGLWERSPGKSQYFSDLWATDHRVIEKHQTALQSVCSELRLGSHPKSPKQMRMPQQTLDWILLSPFVYDACESYA